MPKVTDEHRAARREQIVNAALRCAARQGFHKTTMADVIAESGLSAGAVYGYFKGKTELIEALASRSFAAFADVLGEVVAEPGPVTIEGAFAAIVDRVDQLVALSDGAIARVAVHSWSEAARDDRVAEILRTNIGRVHERWVEVLARAERDGSIRPGIDHDRLARALVGLMPGYLVQGLLLGAVDGPAYSAAVTDLLTATAIEPAAAHA
jgi:AcrR family transcriptional regulator